MSMAHKYQDFSQFQASDDDRVDQADSDSEDEKLKAFEQGYQAGWDDAAKAHDSERQKISADFAQNLQDMSFSYHEALAKLTEAMRPMMGQIIEKLLPKMAQDSLGGHVREQIDALIASEGGGPMIITVAPDTQQALAELMQDVEGEQFEMSLDDTLAPNQVCLRIGTTEREVNLDAVVEGIRASIAAFFQQNKQEVTDG